MIPADLADRVRSWSLSSSCGGGGFNADRAVVEYGPIDLATFEALADTFNAAGTADAFSIVVEVDGALVEIFRGPVFDWRFERRYAASEIITVGILEALDERGKLIRTAAPSTISFLGVDTSPFAVWPFGIYTRQVNSRFAEVVQYLCGLVGLTVSVDSALDYALSQSVVTPGMSLADAVGALMAPLQRTAARADFVRDGQTYTIKKRPLTLGAADVQLPGDIFSMLSYRKSIPKPLAEQTLPATVTPAALYSGGAQVGAANPPAFPSGTYEICFDLPDNSGEICRTYQDGRLVKERTQRVITPTTSGQSVAVEDITFFSYDGTGRLIGHTSQTFKDGGLKWETDWNVTLDVDGRVLAETTVHREIQANGSLIETFREVISKAETESGTMKTLLRETLEADSVTVEQRAYEFSPGDMGTLPEVVAPETYLLAEPADTDAIKADADLTGGKV
ncbi:MAG: hypothetical protein ACRDHY_03335, partial [Anaerolineales bacterium]